SKHKASTFWVRCADDTRPKIRTIIDSSCCNYYNFLLFFLSTASQNVAFSTTLCGSSDPWGAVGPFPSDHTLVYKRVFMNIGQGYDPATGIFKAPVSGVYSFNFHIYGYSTTAAGVSLFKNDERIATAYDHPSKDSTDTASNSALLQLGVGDTVSIRLWADHVIYKSTNNHNTFSGFLVFPV
uniref:C1q domain-containing protein n=1 Tax=Denticeps clupeoides TaxID=299321 RepID=A0AAY3ZWR6_9TELE